MGINNFCEDLKALGTSLNFNSKKTLKENNFTILLTSLVVVFGSELSLAANNTIVASHTMLTALNSIVQHCSALH